MEERVLNAALAGLLHDVGKLEQRARLDPRYPPEGFETEGQPVHAAWSQYFAQYSVAAPYRSAALAGAYHHAPEKSPAADPSLSMLVAVADKLSAGERADRESDETPPRQMVTIFDRLHLERPARQNDWHYLPLRALTLQREAIFPAAALGKEGEGQGYDRLCAELRAAAAQSVGDYPTYLENLLWAMQRTTWCVPSAYYHSIPDVSLYDHSRMTAALAVCLAGREPAAITALLGAVCRDFEKPADAQDRALLEQPVALLVGGDISGIQSFIYTISARGAARTLRGRSFYLQLLTEAILRFVLAQLGLPSTNVIYSGGGHFFLLAPVEAADRLDAIRRQVTHTLLAHHQTSLYLALDYAAVPAAGFRRGEFPRYWGEMHHALAQRKQRRYTELDQELYAGVFCPPQTGGNPEAACSVCGEDYRKVVPFDAEREEQAHICELCDSFAGEFGAPLPKAAFVALGFGEPQDTPPGPASAALRAFGMSVQLLEAGETVKLPEARRVTLWALDDPGDERAWPAAPQPHARALRYTANQVPASTFDALQKQVKGGFERLGVLRMDVDNLGEVFKRGFGLPSASDNCATLARLATLSFQMSLFFEGWVRRLCARYPSVYTVYAGGDDVFLIGPWDIVPDLARQIVSDFNEYTGGHADLHLSAGMAFIDGKYPIYQAAEDAAGALEMAKSLPGKNAFGFLDEAWSWPEFARIDGFRQRLVELRAGDEEAPEALIQVLRRLAADEQYHRSRRAAAGRPIFGPWVWQGMYLLTRMADRYKDRPALHDGLCRLRDELHAGGYQDIHQWGVAARWTQLLLRKKTKKEDDR